MKYVMRPHSPRRVPSSPHLRIDWVEPSIDRQAWTLFPVDVALLKALRPGGPCCFAACSACRSSANVLEVLDSATVAAQLDVT